jgi:RNA polymerase subunit RPABC4/transcription elongation factor Spt4
VGESAPIHEPADIRRQAAEDMGAEVTCSWCGALTPLDAVCSVCGSPMEELVRCRYCGDLTPDPVCRNCHEVLSTMGNLARHSPDKPLLEEALKEFIDRAPSV